MSLLTYVVQEQELFIEEPGFDMREQYAPAADQPAPRLRSLQSRFFGGQKKTKRHASHSYVRVDDASAPAHDEFEGEHERRGGGGEGSGEHGDVELMPLKPRRFNEDDEDDVRFR